MEKNDADDILTCLKRGAEAVGSRGFRPPRTIVMSPKRFAEGVGAGYIDPITRRLNILKLFEDADIESLQ